jgi:ABC-2 type transport system permease protein
MRKIWKIFWFEYRQRVWNWRFLVGLLSGPAVMVLIGLFAGARLSDLGSEETNAMGVVDRSGLIAQAEQALNQDLISSPLYEYDSEEAALKAVDQGKILGYYVLEDTFLQDSAARLVLNKQGGIIAKVQLEKVIRAALLVQAGYEPQSVVRLVDGASIDYEPLDLAAQGLPEDDAGRSNAPLAKQFLTVVLAYVLQFVFFFGITMVNGYVIRILLEERENRTLELLVTSISPRRLLTAKIFANMMVGLTHVVTWVILGVGAVILLTGSAKFLANVNFLQVFLIILYLFLGIVLIAGVNSAIASLVVKPQLASMLTGLVTLPTMIPFLATQAMADQPGSSLSVVLSMIPVTAIQAVPVRLLISTPPWWEILISLLLLAVSAWGVLRLAGWAFQLSIRSGGASPIKFKPFWKRTARGGSRAQ